MNIVSAKTATPKIALVLGGLYLIVWSYFAINPVWRPQWWLDNILVFVFVAVLLWGWYAGKRLSTLSYILIGVFMSLHAWGAHSSYSNVPLGYWMSHTFGFERPNVYDRLVHFLFGFLLSYPLQEVLRRFTKFSPVWTFILSADFILSYSAVYEIIEAATAWTLPPEQYDPFVGLQGDIWDGYRDMALAFLGAVIMMTIVGIWRRYRKTT